MTITQKQYERIQGTFIPKPMSEKLYNKIMAKQDKNIECHNLVKFFVNVYKNNTDEFNLLFDKKIIKDFGNPSKCLEHFCEALSENIFDNCYFKIVSNGIFETIEYSKKKNPNIVPEIYKSFKGMDKEPWSI